LEQSELLAVSGELVDPWFARLGMARQPHLAAARGPEPRFEQEVGAPWYRCAGAQIQCAFEAPAHGCALHWPGEAVADARQGDDALASGWPQRAAQLGDG